MTDLIVTEFGDSWINIDNPTANYGSTSATQVYFGERRTLVRPSLPNIAGRTVVEAILYARASVAMVAQEFFTQVITERWSPGNVTWQRPATGGPAVDAGTVLYTTVGALAAGALIEFEAVTDDIQAVADGTDWWGWRVSTDSTTINQRFRSSESGLPAWELHITLSDVPDQPTDLRPDGGDVDSDEPILSWTFDDAGLDSTAQAKAQVQVDTPAALADPDDVAPDYDSTMVTNLTPEWDLDGEHTLVGAGPHYFRVKVQDADGNESDWSDWAEFGVVPMPTLVVDSPTGAFGDPTPTVEAHLSSGSVASWFIRATGPDRSDIRAGSGNQTGAISWQVPLRGKDGRRVLKDDVQGWFYIRVYPAGDWTTSIGQTAYVDAWVEATWDEELGVEAPTDLAVFQVVGQEPLHQWVWARSEVAEGGYLAQVDGVTVARIEADEVDEAGGYYYWVDGGQVSPLRPHDLRVRALEDGTRSLPAELTGYTHSVEGVWLIPDHEDIGPIRVDGTGVGNFTRTDYRATYVTSTGDEVDVIYGTPSRSGTFEGTIDARESEDVLWAAVTGLETLRDSRVRTGRLVWGSQSAEGRFRDIDVTSAEDVDPSNLRHTVRFGFVEALG